MTTPEILKQRQEQWGDPVTTHIRIAQAWSGILDHTVTALDVALCMAAMKLVRTAVNPSDVDSYDDAIGYVNIAGMVSLPADKYQAMLNDLRGVYDAPQEDLDELIVDALVLQDNIVGHEELEALEEQMYQEQLRDIYGEDPF